MKVIQVAHDFANFILTVTRKKLGLSVIMFWKTNWIVFCDNNDDQINLVSELNVFNKLDEWFCLGKESWSKYSILNYKVYLLFCFNSSKSNENWIVWSHTKILWFGRTKSKINLSYFKKPAFYLLLWPKERHFYIWRIKSLRWSLQKAQVKKSSLKFSARIYSSGKCKFWRNICISNYQIR